MSENQGTPEILGIVPVIPIPFLENEDVDETALRRLVDFAVQVQVKAICLPMYGSEFYKLSDEERTRVVSIAVDQAAGRIKVIGNACHGSSRIALSYAQANVQAGVDMVSVPVPRTFPVTDEDLLQYLVPIFQGFDLPVLLQDFNPGGTTVTVEFVVKLLKECPNFRYIKLEDPLMSSKIKAIREATQDRVGVLEGWGASYLMELLPVGIVGSMPGLAIADILVRVYQLREKLDPDAFDLFEKVLPQITFALQNFELFIYCEKRLLQARGVLESAKLRSCGYTPDDYTNSYIDELNRRILAVLNKHGFEAVWKI